MQDWSKRKSCVRDSRDLGSRVMSLCNLVGKSNFGLCFSPHAESWAHSGMSKKSTHRITEVPKNTLNSFDQESLEHIVSSSDPAISLSSFPFPGPSVMMDGHFKKSFIKNQAHRHGTGKELTKGGRRTCIVCTIACSDSLLTGVM
jgi:hypothetical protein